MTNAYKICVPFEIANLLKFSLREKLISRLILCHENTGLTPS